MQHNNEENIWIYASPTVDLENISILILTVKQPKKLAWKFDVSYSSAVHSYLSH